MRKILMMAAYILLTLQCVGVYAGGKLPLEYGNKNLVVHEDTVKKDTVKKALKLFRKDLKCLVEKK